MIMLGKKIYALLNPLKLGGLVLILLITSKGFSAAADDFTSTSHHRITSVTFKGPDKGYAAELYVDHLDTISPITRVNHNETVSLEPPFTINAQKEVLVYQGLEGHICAKITHNNANRIKEIGSWIVGNDILNDLQDAPTTYKVVLSLTTHRDFPKERLDVSLEPV